ncbi:hypothetical protein F0562_033452 [Nyssa sinensis]|uniref:RecG wedge domain-containing protein n=1 Tax=Nyssa sinensis TaxID=561372 RepID=A0A5J5AES5_9ASTE|nr:hypothetical protein F0562_033452 [Nyssa sinensis]
MCFSEKCLRSAIAFEAERGYRNALGRKMRFNNVLFSKISKLCSWSKHKYAKKLLEEAETYKTASISDRSKLLNKVSVFVGYDGLHDLIENERAQKETSINLKDAGDDFDITLACKRFPSVILGRSPPVELYDGTACSSEKSSLLAAQICKGFLPSPVGAEWVDPDSFSETWPSLRPNLPNMNSSLLKEEHSYTSPLSIQSSTLETEVKSDLPVIKEEPFTGAHLQNAVSVDLILNKAISSIPGLSKRQCRQLENCGFHTLRKLLHHFPRTYADLQNAQIGIEDGQYLIFIGKIISSRGIRASHSFSFLEVVVGCEVTDGELTSEHIIDGIDAGNKRTIYLHLKKFFRGTRFTFQPFLKSLQDKHKEGDIVCVSGKVRTMRTKDHYEMREYNLDVLEDEQDSSIRAKGRPYPIYPSKGGLNPNYLRDFISRALQTLPMNVDPVPKDVTQDFGLVCLQRC